MDQAQVTPEEQAAPFDIDPVKYLAEMRQYAVSEDAQIRELEQYHGIGSTPEPTSQSKPSQQKPETEDEQIARLEKELGIGSQPTTSLGEKYVGAVKKIFNYKDQLTGGGLDSIQNTWNSLVDLADWGENYLASQGYGSGNLIKPGQYRGNLGESMIPSSSSPDERAVRAIGQFVLPFAAWSKAFRVGSAVSGAANFIRAGAAGAATDFTAFDPTNGRLSDMIEKVPSLRNPITGYLASNPKDSGAEGRFKQALEGILVGGALGAMTEGVFLGVKTLKNSQAAKESAKILSRGEQTLEAQKAVTPELTSGIDLPLSAETKAAQADGKIVSQGPQPTGEMVVKQVPGQGTMLDIISDVKATEAQAQKVVSGSPAGELAGNIKLEKYTITDQAKSVIAQADEVFNGEMKAARGAPINMADLQSLADESGLTIQKLMSVPEYQTLGKEGILKLREVVGTSAQLVFDAAEKASIGSMADKAAFLHVLDVHKALQARLEGATAEWGRSGLAFKMEIGAADSATKSKILKEMIGSSGGESTVGEMADLLVKLGKDPTQRAKILGKVLERSAYQKTKDAMFEFYVNMLLSGPRTHINNFISNTSAVISRAAETAGAATMGVVRGSPQGEKIFFGEVGAQLHGMMEGMADGFQLAYKAIKTGKPTMDKLQKFETAFGDSISQLTEKEGTTMGQALGPISSVVSLPSRALMASDEFFKSIHYRASLRQQAVRQSERAGLTGKEFSENVSRLLENPNQEMVIQGIQDMREFTFTKVLTGGAQNVDRAIKSVPGMKVVMPFVKTNLNILEFQIQRSPFAPLLKNVRSDLAQGGIARDMALSRMAIGTAAMGTAAYYAGQGMLTGAGPANVEARKLLEQTGWQPYSVVVDGKYYRYDKMDPFGGLLAMAADFAEIKEQLDTLNPNDADELALASVGVLADHLTPNFLIDSMGSFAEAIRNPQGQEGKRFLVNLATGMTSPSLARAITRYNDPTKRDVTPDPKSPHPIFESIVRNWKSTIPQYAKELPPQRNIFGEPVVLGPGYGPDAFSPVYSTTKKSSPALDEMIRLEMAGPILKPEGKPGEAHFIVSMPPRQISVPGQSGPVKLSPEKYDKFVQLAAGIGLKGMPGERTLKEELNRIVTGKFQELGPFKDNDEHRKIYLAKTISGYRAAAIGQMKTNGDLSEGINEEFMKKITDRVKKLNAKKTLEIQ